MKISAYNLKGVKTKDVELSEDIFNVSSNNELLHQVYVAIGANKRVAIAHTKDKSEVIGSGKKPWKQKGTGRARTGSVKNPIWRKGGVIFGPTKDRNFKKKINRKSKQKAIKIALSEKLRSANLVVIDEISITERKTKEMARALNSLKLKGSILLTLSGDERNLYPYARNIENLTCLPIDTLNVYDILNHKNLILSEDAVKYLKKKYK